MTAIFISTNSTPLSFPSPHLPISSKHKPRRGSVLADPAFIYSSRAQLLVPTNCKQPSQLCEFQHIQQVIPRAMHIQGCLTFFSMFYPPPYCFPALLHHSVLQMFSEPSEEIGANCTVTVINQHSLLWGSLPSTGEQRTSCHPAPRKTKCSFREEEALLLGLVRWVEFGVFAKG